MFMVIPPRNNKIHSISFRDGNRSSPFETYQVKNASIWQKMYYRTLLNNFYVTVCRKENGKTRIVCVHKPLKSK